MMQIVWLFIAATLEVGGDALCRSGMRGGKIIPVLIGGLVLWLYGIVVNLPKWDFGRLLGVYIAIFFVVSQLIAALVFHESIHLPTLVGGGLIVAGGLILVIWGGNPTLSGL